MTLPGSLIRTATIQFKPTWGAPDENRARLITLLGLAAENGSQVIILPEMCVSGYVFHSRAEIEPYCESRNGATYELISQFCRQRAVYVAYGFAEKAGEQLFNSQNLIGPGGEILATYRKTHLYEQDTHWALPGNSGFIAVETDLGRLGLGICMDMNFDDFVEFHIGAQTDLICFSSCWLDEGFPVAPYWAYRLQEYAGSICIANSFGDERGILFRGESSVFANRQLIARGSLNREQILVTEIFS